ncbi:pantothenate kinase [Oscillatoria amoena NRMC-F 0135]|nr:MULTISPECIES: pantothenate kinase [Cyanophyceae]MDA0211649.1 pantothenate kinase [Cyanobacteria bacterium FC1]MDL5045188.1 pantothenate kinase [Oscillatoria amoena NRMC-F 0135]MDL5056329.1 pantothenate kinase [Geitlerinema calcuttense NRMC-F 0142]
MTNVIHPQTVDPTWLALMIGNSRLHWALFSGKTLREAWEIDQVPVTAIERLIQQWAQGDWPEAIFPLNVREWVRQAAKAGPIPLYLASVVPAQTSIWQTYPATTIVTPDRLPLKGLYPTLGIDRALAILGAGNQLGWPVLVLDAGTALTLTGADGDRHLVGGAILPGLGLQLHALVEHTAALPIVEARSDSTLPPRWALNTADAVESGIVYTMVAGIQDFIGAWRTKFPDSAIAMTGGDSTSLLNYLQAKAPEVAAIVQPDPHLIFWGIRSVALAQLPISQ